MTRLWRRNAVIILGLAVVFAIIFGTVYVLSFFAPTPGLLCTDPNSTQPSVSFGPASNEAVGVRIPVTRLAPNCAHDVLPSSFWVDLEKNTTWADSAVGMPGASNATVDISFVSGLIYQVRWTDADASGDLSVGDYFTVTCPRGFPPADGYTFTLLWQDGPTLVSADFVR